MQGLREGLAVPRLSDILEPQQLEDIRTYSNVIGVSLQKCLREAVSDWLEAVAPPRLERVARRSAQA